MASSQQQLAFAVRAVNEASATLKQVQKDIDGIGDTATRAAPKTSMLGGALGNVASIAGGFVVANGLMQLPGFLIGAAQAAAEDQAATMRLEQSLKNYAATIDDDVLGITEELMQDVQERIKAGEKLAFTDDQVRDSLQTLLAATGDYGEATKRQKAAMDLSRGAGIDLTAATKLLAKANEENVQVLKRMGIVLKDGATEADLLAAVQEKFGGQADAYAKSTAGQFEVAKIQMAELKEQIGVALLPAMTRIAQILVDDVIPAVTKFVEWIGPKIEAAMPTIEAAAQIFRNDVWPVIVDVTEATLAFLDALGKVIGVAKEVAGVVGGIKLPSLPGSGGGESNTIGNAVKEGAVKGIINAVIPGGAIVTNANAIFKGITGRAEGGPVSAGVPYMVGERGPELFVPNSNGRIAANAGSVVVNIYGNLLTSQAEIQRMILDGLHQAQQRGSLGLA